MVLDPMPALPDEADPTTWVARWRALLEWMGTLGTAISQVSPFIDAYDAILAQTNFIGNWDDQSGAKTVPTSVYHEGAMWLLLENISDIASDEPGDSAKWLEFPSPSKDLSARAFTSPVTGFDFALPSPYRRFTLQAENMTHDGSVARALGASFSADNGASFTAPVAISGLVGAGEALDDDIEFYLSPNTARSMNSSIGRVGMIVPAGANVLRLTPCKAGKVWDRLEPIAGTARLLLTGFRGL